MRLTALVHREGEQVPAQRSNYDHETLVLGVLHEDTNSLLSFMISPEGHIGVTHLVLHRSQVNPVYHALGHINPDGTVVLVEPHIPGE